MSDTLSREPRENVEEAFRIAHHGLGIPPLLEPDDDDTHSTPDEQSIITYVSQFLEHYPGLDEDSASDFDMSSILFRDNTNQPAPETFTPAEITVPNPDQTSASTPPPEAKTWALSLGQERIREQPSKGIVAAALFCKQWQSPGIR
ncbi:hypothetical protein J4Q44_G00346550 [Coregonus suidteri]|uniref:Calponin-homology (CH) domain-containing protein n=1 Tax=Coregonus suidteri TaxID=861788 RepID=A0AAN8Q8L3_9TELE